MERGIGDNSDAVMGDWIALSRSTASHWVVGFGKPVKPADPKKGAYSRGEAWIDLIMLARWKPGQENNKGRKVELEAGQLQGGYEFLACRWNWTLKQVRLFLSKLVGEGMIDKSQPKPDNSAQKSKVSSKKGKQNSNQIQVITLCNYRKYQVAKELMEMEERQAEGQARGKRGASEGQHLNKETKKEERKKDSVPNGTGESPPVEVTARERVWGSGLEWLRPQAFLSEAKLRTRLGGWVKDYGPEAVLKAFEQAHRCKPGAIMSWLEKVLAENDKADHEVAWQDGRIVAKNGFAVELAGLVGDRDLQKTVDRIAGRIAVSTTGSELRNKVRSLVTDLIEKEAEQTKRYENAKAQGDAGKKSPLLDQMSKICGGAM